MKKASRVKGDLTASQRIDNQIAELADWRGQMLTRLRKLIRSAVPGTTEEWKWGTAVWSQKGPVCSAGAFKDHVKLNFFQGASLKDPKHLFNSGLEAKGTRAMDFREGDNIDEPALRDLLRAASAYNMAGGKTRSK